MAINNRIKELRKQNNWTQKQLADKANVSPQVISNWERGYTSLGNDDVVMLSEIFDCSTDYLNGKTDQKHLSVGDKVLPGVQESEEKTGTLTIINEMVEEFGIEDFGFFDIDKWRSLSPEDIKEIRSHFEWVSQKAKERNGQ